MRKNFMKKVVAGMLTAVMAFSLTACGGGDASTNDTAKEEGSSDVITVGFSQVGAESDWRTANSESMKSTFTKDNGYELIFDDAQQKQENQISAIRNFIQQEVDYIVLAPVTETGWDAVLGEAKQAGIPVIIVDRMVDVKDDSLYTAWVGSNFELEGKLSSFPAKVYATESRIDQSTRTLTVRALYANSNGALLPGRYASIQLKKEEIPNAIAIPSEAIVPEMGKDKVFLYKSGKAEPVEITAGIRTEAEVQVIKGLQMGDTIITSGTLQLRTGLPVTLDNIN